MQIPVVPVNPISCSKAREFTPVDPALKGEENRYYGSFPHNKPFCRQERLLPKTLSCIPGREYRWWSVPPGRGIRTRETIYHARHGENGPIAWEMNTKKIFMYVQHSDGRFSVRAEQVRYSGEKPYLWGQRVSRTLKRTKETYDRRYLKQRVRGRGHTQ